MESRNLLEQAFRRHGITDYERLANHILGCDLTSPVVEEVLDAGVILEVWVRNNGVPGMFGAPAGEDPATLGIRIDKRHRVVFRVRTSLHIVRCTAAMFPSGRVDEVGGAGGGTQYILPPGWMNHAERIG